MSVATLVMFNDSLTISTKKVQSLQVHFIQHKNQRVEEKGTVVIIVDLWKKDYTKKKVSYECY